MARLPEAVVALRRFADGRFDGASGDGTDDETGVFRPDRPARFSGNRQPRRRARIVTALRQLARTGPSMRRMVEDRIAVYGAAAESLPQQVAEELRWQLEYLDPVG